MLVCEALKMVLVTRESSFLAYFIVNPGLFLIINRSDATNFNWLEDTSDPLQLWRKSITKIGKKKKKAEGNKMEKKK